ncbi:hypothetical protein GLOTRDRAFT_134798 [Gloeophyllum trabeum ATCC 11539]|uniref:Uncharacterized protein n=1 Tax=Gloeophyllum trabeum (strain ATCC 11539 / FP-39264 / Madison 617) TaxID=670483 RepID=S7QL67_GLOTA|nr:uncharacterized protein GLOTRDRAFT_134798 [Gloeophyllum trabeum ATCC 11539]EPQ60033.1 hypothetical protein GLOTRDRAFT_134798 [Gloeophyllum trabeum ATCC 11539]
MPAFFLHNLALLFAALSCVVSLFFSLLLTRTLAGRTLRVSRIRLHLRPSLSIHVDGFYYSHRTSIPRPDLKLPNQPFTLKAAQVVLRFRVPRPSYPAWATLTIKDIFHASPQASASVERALLTLWLFPYAFRFTAGTYVNVQLDDFRVRVFDSESTPRWVEILRRNLIMTMLKGETLRLDDFKTSVRFGVPDRWQSPESKQRQEVDGMSGEQEMMVTVMGEKYHTKNWQGRIYALGKVDMQWRTSLSSDRGRFVMVMEEARWIKVRETYELETPISTPYQILSSILQLPVTLWQTYNNIATAADVYIPVINLSYDQFRLRDSEVVHQIGIMVEENMWAIGGFLEGFVGDLLTKSIQPGGGKAGALADEISEGKDSAGPEVMQEEEKPLEEKAADNQIIMDGHAEKD